MRSILLAAALAATTPALAAPDDLPRLKAQAARISIVRDEWGIAHVHGRSDADAVFGAIYAQAEDDFNRIKTNYLVNLGRLAEAEGESALWQDLRMRLFVDPADLQRRYAASPAPLKRLMVAWADGLNFYLATHPQVRPRVLTRFEPWMALSFTEGSIGGDIERIQLGPLAALYGGEVKVAARDPDPLAFREPQGSNGIAIAPSATSGGRALLLINPHTSFFFRSELQMTSDEGLDAYGAATWGQFFIYQGFNRTAGWMHTSSGVDVVDDFAESVERQGDQVLYRYGGKLRPVAPKPVTLRVRQADGTLAERSFTTWHTHHGPVVRVENGRWITTALMFKPVEALQQSFGRTKAKDLAGFLKVAEFKANSSNNTLFADSKGQIAYLHPQFVPRRDDRFDYTQPVDGSDPATDWKGLTPLRDLPRMTTPAGGWLMNVNDAPWAMAGAASPKRERFPRYMDSAGPNPRTAHALHVLEGRRDFTAERLIAAAYDPALPAFDRLLPPLFAAFDQARAPALAEPVALLRGWDRRWAATSTETTLAVYWGEALWAKAAPAARAAKISVYDWMAERSTPGERLAALSEAVAKLTADFGGWRVPWGEVNRYQRNDAAIVQRFDDGKPSTPVPFTSSQWGSLASFGAKSYPGTKRRYGTSGNSFVAVVEFGTQPHAWAVTAGGESGDPTSPHFADQAQRYADGALRPVHFLPQDVAEHTVRRYRPGD